MLKQNFMSDDGSPGGAAASAAPGLRALAAPVINALRRRETIVLILILLFGAYLRLWNINHSFDMFHDYDEGAYALGGYFISQGFLPYQDFFLAHPPLYDLTLGLLYRVFGYSFFYGRYLSVALSLACIVIIYLIGRKTHHPTAGLVAALLFAITPDTVFVAGRSVYQEPLGLFFAADRPFHLLRG